MSRKMTSTAQGATRRAAKAAPDQAAGQLEVIVRVSLAEITPAIWRQIRLSGAMTLEDLHFAIQGAFGWENSHMHVFTLSADETYSVSAAKSWSADVGVEGAGDAAKITLQEIVARKIKRFTYEYDFGDSWLHEITIESASPATEPIAMPQCLAGERNGPPDDCGGVPGYYNFVEAMSDPKHPEHRELKEWHGGKYKPELFSVKTANDGIKWYRAPARWS